MVTAGGGRMVAATRAVGYMRDMDCRLYLITPPVIDDLAVFGRRLAAALEAGDVAAVQVRLKDAPEAVVVAAVAVLLLPW